MMEDPEVLVSDRPCTLVEQIIIQVHGFLCHTLLFFILLKLIAFIVVTCQSSLSQHESQGIVLLSNELLMSFCREMR